MKGDKNKSTKSVLWSKFPCSMSEELVMNLLIFQPMNPCGPHEVVMQPPSALGTNVVIARDWAEVC